MGLRNVCFGEGRGTEEARRETHNVARRNFNKSAFQMEGCVYCDKVPESRGAAFIPRVKLRAVLEVVMVIGDSGR